MLTKSRVEKRTAREPRLTDGEAFMPDDRSVAESTSTWGVVNVDASELADPTEDLKVPSSKLPWAICKFFTLVGFVASSSLIILLYSFRKWWLDHKLYCTLSGTIRCSASYIRL